MMNNRYTALLLLLLPQACTTGAENASGRADLAEVKRGSLTISVTESGEIKAAKSTRVMNEMEGNSTIIFLIPEGTVVKKGEKIVELDASSQVERKATQEISVVNAKATVINATKRLEILRKAVWAADEAAKIALEFAKMDKDKFYGAIDPKTNKREMGEREQTIKAGEENIAIARSTLKLAEEKFNWSKKLFVKEFITQTELDTDKHDFASKQTRLVLAINELKILRKYTHAKTKRELDQAELDADLEQQRTKAKGEAEIMQAEADLSSNIAEDKLASERLENLERQIESAVVRAPTPGIVVYATEGDRYRRRTVEEGAQVRERQTLIILPDVTHMQALLKIQEVMIDKIRPGLPALITIDTTPIPLRGTVLRRAPLPDSAGRMANPDLKEYKTTVDIFGSNENNLLRPNMSATIKIIISQLENVLSVPQAAVHSQGAVQYAWLRTPDGPVAKRVKTGEHNESHVVILEGLEEGDKVYLLEPAGVTAPEYEQPESIEPKFDAAAIQASLRRSGVIRGTTNGGSNGDGDGRSNRGSRRGQGGNAMSRYTELADAFKTKVKARNPALFAQIEAAGRNWSRDADVKAAIEADAELGSAFGVYQAERRKIFSQLRNSRGGGERGERGGRSRRGRRDGGAE